VVKALKKMYPASKHPDFAFKEMDARCSKVLDADCHRDSNLRDLSGFADESFDIVFDKATTDGLLCSDESAGPRNRVIVFASRVDGLTGKISSMYEGVARILKSVSCSLSQTHRYPIGLMACMSLCQSTTPHTGELLHSISLNGMTPADGFLTTCSALWSSAEAVDTHPDARGSWFRPRLQVARSLPHTPRRGVRG
jgi:hypothetical protein